MAHAYDTISPQLTSEYVVQRQRRAHVLQIISALTTPRGEIILPKRYHAPVEERPVIYGIQDLAYLPWHTRALAHLRFLAGQHTDIAPRSMRGEAAPSPLLPGVTNISLDTRLPGPAFRQPGKPIVTLTATATLSGDIGHRRITVTANDRGEVTSYLEQGPGARTPEECMLMLNPVEGEVLSSAEQMLLAIAVEAGLNPPPSPRNPADSGARIPYAAAAA